jgi:hypothetical protein
MLCTVAISLICQDWGVVISLASIGIIPAGAFVLGGRAKRMARRAAL